MYNLYSLIFLFVGLFYVGKTEFHWIALIFSMSVGFALAGSISSLSNTINNIFNLKIKIHNCVNGDKEISKENDKNNKN